VTRPEASSKVKDQIDDCPEAHVIQKLATQCSIARPSSTNSSEEISSVMA
jgi:hypothetical protein